MAFNDREVRSIPSVLDRLLDYDPRMSEEAPRSRSIHLQELKQSVRRDLEWLLNTRCHYENIDDRLEEAPNSVAFYGLPDFTGFSAKNHNEQKKIVKAIETAIKNFEPRFLDPRVTMEPINNVDRLLKFRIEARLDVDPAPEPIAFDTVLQIGSGDFQVVEK
ncbi:MAG: type VI secretion system baseplate subunit TssE [Blastocatellia bacterium]